MHSTIAGLRVYDEAYKIRREIEDEKAFLQGMYFRSAIESTIGNMFKSKGSKPIKYIEKPILQILKDRNRVLTEEEKQVEIDNLFAMLGSMQKRFEESHKGGEG